MTDHQPITPEYRDLLNRVAKLLDDVFNSGLTGDERKVGFALLLFPFGEKPDQRVNYIANASREDMIAALKEFIARNEGRYHSQPGRMQ